MSKQGSTLAGVMDAFSVAISIGLQYGVPLEAFVNKFTNMRFDPAGMTDDPDVRFAQSVMDYIFRRLALDYLSYSDRAALGILTAEERVGQLNASGGEEIDVEGMRSSAPVEAEARASRQDAPLGPAETTPRATVEVTPQTDLDAPLCFTCGVKMRRAGSCYVCESCGSTSGCS